MRLTSALLLLLCGCQSRGSFPDSPYPTQGHYVKDTRTGICFYRYYEYLTYVPCTEEVEKLIAEYADRR